MSTPELLKLSVKPQRTMFSKLNGKFTASMLGVYQTGNTREEAIAKLAEMLDKTMEHAYARRYLVCSDGTVFAMYHVPGGWSYDIIHPGKPGAVSPGSCMMSEKPFSDAYAAMKSHWEQMEADLNSVKLAS